MADGDVLAEDGVIDDGTSAQAEADKDQQLGDLAETEMTEPGPEYDGQLSTDGEGSSVPGGFDTGSGVPNTTGGGYTFGEPTVMDGPEGGTITGTPFVDPNGNEGMLWRTHDADGNLVSVGFQSQPDENGSWYETHSSPATGTSSTSYHNSDGSYVEFEDNHVEGTNTVTTVTVGVNDDGNPYTTTQKVVTEDGELLYTELSTTDSHGITTTMTTLPNGEQVVTVRDEEGNYLGSPLDEHGQEITPEPADAEDTTAEAPPAGPETDSDPGPFGTEMSQEELEARLAELEELTRAAEAAEKAGSGDVDPAPDESGEQLGEGEAPEGDPGGGVTDPPDGEELGQEGEVDVSGADEAQGDLIDPADDQYSGPSPDGPSDGSLDISVDDPELDASDVGPTGGGGEESAREHPGLEVDGPPVFDPVDPPGDMPPRGGTSTVDLDEALVEAEAGRPDRGGAEVDEPPVFDPVEPAGGMPGRGGKADVDIDEALVEAEAGGPQSDASADEVVDDVIAVGGDPEFADPAGRGDAAESAGLPGGAPDPVVTGPRGGDLGAGRGGGVGEVGADPAVLDVEPDAPVVQPEVTSPRGGDLGAGRGGRVDDDPAVLDVEVAVEPADPVDDVIAAGADPEFADPAGRGDAAESAGLPGGSVDPVVTDPRGGDLGAGRGGRVDDDPAVLDVEVAAPVIEPEVAEPRPEVVAPEFGEGAGEGPRPEPRGAPELPDVDEAGADTWVIEIEEPVVVAVEPHVVLPADEALAHPDPLDDDLGGRGPIDEIDEDLAGGGRALETDVALDLFD